jgi:hypothetical protein
MSSPSRRSTPAGHGFFDGHFHFVPGLAGKSSAGSQKKVAGSEKSGAWKTNAKNIQGYVFCGKLAGAIFKPLRGSSPRTWATRSKKKTPAEPAAEGKLPEYPLWRQAGLASRCTLPGLRHKRPAS